MVVNGQSLLAADPLDPMFPTKMRDDNGVSYGLAEVGYDIRIAQTVHFHPDEPHPILLDHGKGKIDYKLGRFTLASAIERFHMPCDLVGIVHDKSTWARKGLSVFNTVIEPGWNGFLTLELSFRHDTPFTIPAGAGIAQVVFHRLENPAQYDGSYQDQQAGPVVSIVK